MAKMPKGPAPVIPDAATEAPAEPQQIEMISPSGERQFVREQHAGTLAALGYKQVTQGMLDAMAEKEKYGKGIVNELEAGALGAARGLTFGVSDLAIKAGEDSGLLPEGSTYGAQKLKQYNPDASTAGEIGSLIVPGLGAAGLLGKAGKVASSLGVAQRSVSAGGSVIGSTVEAIAKRIVGESAGKIAGSAAHLAAEAAVYQAAHNISEESLFDRDLTAESVLANTGHAAILGAGLGAVVPAAVMTGKAIAEKAIDSTPVQWAANKAAKVVEKFFDPDRSAALYSGAMSKGELLRDTIKGQRFQGAVHDLREGGFFKSGSVDLDAATGKIVQVEKGALPSQQQAYERLQDMIDKAGAGMGDTLRGADEAAAGKSFELWGAKDSEALTKKITDWQKTLRITPSEAERLQSTLGELESGINASEGRLQDLHAIRRGLDARIGPKNFEKLGGEEIELVKDIRRTLSEKISGRMEQLGEEGVIPKETATRWKALNKVYGNLKTIEGPLDMARARAEANVNVGGLRWRDLLAGSIGASAFGPIGAAAGIANHALQTEQGLLMRAAIGERVQQLAWAEKLTNATQKGVVDSVKNFVHGLDAGKVAETSLRRVGAVEADAIAQGSTPTERRAAQQEWFHDTQERLVAVAEDPQKFAVEQGKALEAMSAVAPELRDQIVQKQVDILSYLVSVMPKNGADPLQPGKVKWNPADYEIKKFKGVVQVAQKPLSIIDDLRTGKVTREQTEAIQTLYPKIYEQMSRQVESQINAPKAPKLTYPQRLRLGILFPGVEPTLAPDFIRDMSKYMGAAEEPKKQSGIRSTSNLDLSKNFTTELEGISQ